jgi:hypothetical protein
VEDEIRENMTAEQCARWTVFCENHKFRENISLNCQFQHKSVNGVSNSVEEEMEKLVLLKMGRKKNKTELR